MTQSFMISVTKKFTFDAGHRLSNYTGKCRWLHGHTYKCEITIVGNHLDDKGMVIDFGDLKKIFKTTVEAKFDHRMILNEKDLINQKLAKALPKRDASIVWVDYNPTAENMAKDIFGMIHRALPAARGIRVAKVVLYETPNSKAEYGE